MSNLFETLITRSWEQRLLKEAIRLGREEGANGRPAADTPKYDVGETHVRGEIEKQVVKAGEGVSTELQRIVPTITKKDGELSQVELTFQTRKMADDVAQTFDGLIASARAALEEAHFRKHETEGHYKKFRLENNVTIDPDHATDRLNYLSVLFLLLAAETVLNAFFWGYKFGENFSLGLLVAFVISGLNILIGFVSGVALSYRNVSGQ